MLKTFLILILFSLNCHAFLGLEKIKPLQADFSLLKATVADKALQNADALAKVNARIDRVEARIDTQAGVIAGVGNKLQQTQTTTSAGRDSKQVNIGIDKENLNTLIKSYEKTINILTYQLIGLATLMVGQLFALLTLIFKNTAIRDEETARREAKNDEMQMKLIEELMTEDKKKEEMK